MSDNNRNTQIESDGDTKTRERVKIHNRFANRPLLFQVPGRSVRLGPGESETIEKDLLNAHELRCLCTAGLILVEELRAKNTASTKKRDSAKKAKRKNEDEEKVKDKIKEETKETVKDQATKNSKREGEVKDEGKDEDKDKKVTDTHRSEEKGSKMNLFGRVGKTNTSTKKQDDK